MLIFALLAIETELKQLSQIDLVESKKVDSIFYDLMIILKDLNNGQSFETTYLTDLFKFSKLLGFVNLTTNKLINNKRSILLEKLGKPGKSYSFLCQKNVLVLLKDDKIAAIIFLSSSVYFYQADRSRMTIDILSQSGKNNVVIFKNKDNYIKYNKYQKLILRFPDIDGYNEVYSCFNL
jgi:hypothetical protein